MPRRYSQQARAIVNGLSLPDPWDVDELCLEVARLRGRPLLVIARPSPSDEITGTVFRQADRDVIFVRDDLDPLHRDHVKCHELAHLLAGHLEGPVAYNGGADEDLARAADIMLHRQCMYGEARERIAEEIAELILARVRQRVSGVTDPAMHRVVRGLAEALR